MGVALELPVTLTSIDCGQCGGVYAINERYRKQCQDYGRAWHCPYCQTGWGFVGNGALEKAQKALEAEKQRHQDTLGRLNDETAQRAKAERATARLKKRVHAGLCTCCNRTFANLARHMASKHKDAA